jgi:hypothetical protein
MKIMKGMAIRLAVVAAMVLSGFLWVDGARAASAAKAKETLDEWLFLNKPEFFRLDPFHIPVIRDGRVVNQVSVLVVIETLGVAHKDKVIDKRRRLYSAFLNDLHGVLSIRNGSGHALNAPAVKQRLKKRAEGILGPGVVKNVLIRSAMKRRR